MANQSGHGRNVLRPDENRESWRPHDQQMQRDGDEDRYARDRDRDGRRSRGERRPDDGGHWEDDRQRMTDRQGMGQSGYGAGRQADDPSVDFHSRNSLAPSYYDDAAELGVDDRWTGRGHWQDQSRRGGYNPERQGATGGYGGGRGFEDPRGSERFEPAPRRSQPSFRGKGPKGYARSDERIREQVCEALADDHDVDATDIEVQVTGGEVTLTGHVPERSMKRAAEDCLEHVPGVRDVHNQLRVGADRGNPTGADPVSSTDRRHRA